MSTKKLDWVADIVEGLPALLNVKEAAAILRNTPRSVHRMIASAKLHGVKYAEGGSSRTLIPRAELERYLRSLDVGAVRAA
jgi:excisionase family DNA binding protein